MTMRGGSMAHGSLTESPQEKRKRMRVIRTRRSHPASVRTSAQAGINAFFRLPCIYTVNARRTSDADSININRSSRGCPSLRFSQVQAILRESLANFIEACLPEIAAGKQLGFASTDEFSKGLDVKFLDRLSRPARRVELCDGRGVNAFVRWWSRRLLCGDGDGIFVKRLTKTQSLGVKHVLDFLQRCLAEVLVCQKLGLGGAHQVSECANVHLLEAVAGTYRKLEIGDGNIQHRIATGKSFRLVLVEVHRLGIIDILDEHSCPGVTGIGRQNATQAHQGLVVLPHILEKNSKIHQGV